MHPGEWDPLVLDNGFSPSRHCPSRGSGLGHLRVTSCNLWVGSLNSLRRYIQQFPAIEICQKAGSGGSRLRGSPNLGSLLLCHGHSFCMPSFKQPRASTCQYAVCAPDMLGTGGRTADDSDLRVRSGSELSCVDQDCDCKTAHHLTTSTNTMQICAAPPTLQLPTVNNALSSLQQLKSAASARRAQSWAALLLLGRDCRGHSPRYATTLRHPGRSTMTTTWTSTARCEMLAHADAGC